MQPEISSVSMLSTLSTESTISYPTILTSQYALHTTQCNIFKFNSRYNETQNKYTYYLGVDFFGTTSIQTVSPAEDALITSPEKLVATEGKPTSHGQDFGTVPSTIDGGAKATSPFSTGDIVPTALSGTIEKIQHQFESIQQSSETFHNDFESVTEYSRGKIGGISGYKSIKDVKNVKTVKPVSRIDSRSSLGRKFILPSKKATKTVREGFKNGSKNGPSKNFKTISTFPQGHKQNFLSNNKLSSKSPDVQKSVHGKKPGIHSYQSRVINGQPNMALTTGISIRMQKSSVMDKMIHTNIILSTYQEPSTSVGWMDISQSDLYHHITTPVPLFVYSGNTNTMNHAITSTSASFKSTDMFDTSMGTFFQYNNQGLSNHKQIIARQNVNLGKTTHEALDGFQPKSHVSYRKNRGIHEGASLVTNKAGKRRSKAVMPEHEGNKGKFVQGVSNPGRQHDIKLLSDGHDQAGGLGNDTRYDKHRSMNQATTKYHVIVSQLGFISGGVTESRNGDSIREMNVTVGVTGSITIESIFKEALFIPNSTSNNESTVFSITSIQPTRPFISNIQHDLKNIFQPKNQSPSQRHPRYKNVFLSENSNPKPTNKNTHNAKRHVKLPGAPMSSGKDENKQADKINYGKGNEESTSGFNAITGIYTTYTRLVRHTHYNQVSQIYIFLIHSRLRAGTTVCSLLQAAHR